MIYKSIASPKPSAGMLITSKKQVVPNQSMSLQEILERFTRGEPLPIGHEAQYHESDDDLEKLQTMDLVDRHEYIDKLKSVQFDFEKSEKNKLIYAQKQAIEKAKNELRKEFENEKKLVDKDQKAE